MDSDHQLALWLADEAIARVEEHAHPDWLVEADEAVFAVALRLRRFTTDDVWEALSEVTVTTHERRALGATMRRASAGGLCVATDSYQISKRRACHGRPLRVWKSLLFDT